MFLFYFFRKSRAKSVVPLESLCFSATKWRYPPSLKRKWGALGVRNDKDTRCVINGLIAYACYFTTVCVYPRSAPREQPSILAMRPACLPPSNSVEAKVSIMSSMTPFPTTRSPKQRIFASLCCLVSFAV